MQNRRSPFIDPSFERIITVARAELISVGQNSISELRTLIRQRVPQPTSEGHTWDRDAALAYLYQCRQVLEQEMLRLTRPYPPLQWLWYLRRLPRIYFANFDIHLDVETTRLATIASGLSPATTAFIPPIESANYDTERQFIRRALRLCRAASLLLRIQKRIGVAAFGCSYGPQDDDLLPQAVGSPETRDAIDLYNARGHTSAGFLNRVGTKVSARDSNDADVFLTVTPLASSGQGNSVLHPFQDRRQSFLPLNNYGLEVVSLHQLSQLGQDHRLQQTRWIQSEAGALLLLLRLVMIMAQRTNRLDELHILGRSYGYYVQRESVFRDIAEWALGTHAAAIQRIIPNIELPAGSDELLQILDECKGSLWPPIPGPVIFRSGENLYLDLETATARLESLIEYPRETGAVANARADHFELAIQKVINESPWRPPNKLLALRRVDLTYEGSKVTDFDAIGAREKTLLIVSCKSILYSTKYALGMDYKLVRNSSSLVTSAIETWNEKKRFFELHPVGQNYDISEYDHIIAVVCTPHIVYTPIGEATEEIAPGLRATATLSELATWLESE